MALINKGFKVLIDDSAQNFTEIHISGGQRGLNIKLGLRDLADLIKARITQVSRPGFVV